MTAADASTFARLMQRLGDAFTPLSEGQRALYFDHLAADLTLAEARVAVDRAVCELHSTPTIAQLRQLVKGTQQERAALAWSIFKHLVRWPAIIRVVELRYAPLIEATVSMMGGWAHLEKCKRLDVPREEFVQVFGVLERHPEWASRWYWYGKRGEFAPAALLTLGLVRGRPSSAPLPPEQEAERVEFVRALLAAGERAGFG